MAYYILNVTGSDATEATRLLRTGLWGVPPHDVDRDALVPGDHVLIYLAAPLRVFVGRAELASAIHEWTPAEAAAHPLDSRGGVALTDVEEWEPPVPMHTVLAQIDTSAGARADFDAYVVQITEDEYRTAVSVAAARAKPAE